MEPKRVNRNKQVRLDEILASRVRTLVERSGLAESDILRLALAAGLDRLESGATNPFADQGKASLSPRLSMLNEDPAQYAGHSASAPKQETIEPKPAVRYKVSRKSRKAE